MNCKNRFFPCFRPVTMDSPVRRERRANVPGEPVFTYIPAGEMNEGMVFPKIFPPVFAGDIDKKEVDCGRREKSANGRLSRIMKAVLSGRSLRGKSRSFRSEISNSMKEYPRKRQNLSDEENLKANSKHSSSLRCSSAPFASTYSRSSTRTSNNTRPLPERRNSLIRSNSSGPKQRLDIAQKHGNEGCGFNAGLFLLLICLLVLIFWGKICAIFCTSTWFFLVPRSSRLCVSPEAGKEFYSGIGFEKNKKKVIMEGLLGRNHARRVNPF